MAGPTSKATAHCSGWFAQTAYILVGAGLIGGLIVALGRSLAGRLARRLSCACLARCRRLVLLSLAGCGWLVLRSLSRGLVLLRRRVGLAVALPGRVLRRRLASLTLTHRRRLALRGADLVRHAKRSDRAGIDRASGLETFLSLESHQCATRIGSQDAVCFARQQASFDQNLLNNADLVGAEIQRSNAANRHRSTCHAAHSASAGRRE
ncbi:pimeloyl-ACP methyl ester carboxylesterase [Bradyrhizobium sp. LM3.6]